MDTLFDIFSLRGRTALVTGASSGIGRHAAHLFAAAGATVALAARRVDRLDEAVQSIREAGGRAAPFELDVTVAQSISQMYQAVHDAFGCDPDILLNNAGVLVAERFIMQTEAQVDAIFDTNLKGAFLVAQEAARRMAAMRRGSIINVASTSALRAGGFMASYAASKAGLVHASRVMALELAGKGVRVNALCPGNFETDMQATLAEFDDAMRRRTPMRRFGKPDELDGALLLLASEAGRYITGAEITVDGGQALSWM